MSIVNALKKLVVALGGASDPDAVPGGNVAEVVNEVTNAVGKQQNTFTPFVVTIEDNSEVVSSDVAFEDLVEAVESDQLVVCKFSGNVDGEPVNVVTTDYYKIYSGSDLAAIVFAIAGRLNYGGAMYPYVISINIEGNTITYGCTVADIPAGVTNG